LGNTCARGVRRLALGHSVTYRGTGGLAGAKVPCGDYSATRGDTSQLPRGFFESGDEVTERDLHARVFQQAEAELDRALRTELDGISVTRLLLRGNPANEIARTARDRNIDLIVMPTHGDASFYRFLLGYVTGKVLHESPCPVWTGAHLEDTPRRDFSIRNVLCAIDLTPHSRHAASVAAEMAAAADATLTFVPITAGVKMWGPGGSHVDPAWQKTILGIAEREAAQLQAEIGTHAQVIVDSGNVPPPVKRSRRAYGCGRFGHRTSSRAQPSGR
jgi:nucleotide-binding universal stress UspA family protein